MLPLTIASPDQVAPALPEGPNAAPQVWRDNDGTICAYGYTADQQHWMVFPGLASFCFGGDTARVTAFPEPAVRVGLIWDTYWRSVLPMALQVFGQEALHASAVRMPQGMVALCAVSETGKSTIACALSRRGYTLCADDAVVFELADSGVQTISLPFSLRLRPASAAHFGYGAAGVDIPAGWAGDEPLQIPPVPLVAICVLERSRDAAPAAIVDIDRLAPVPAFRAVLTHAYCFSLDDLDRKQRMMRQYLELAMRVPIFQVRFQAGLHNLPRILDAIEQAVGKAALDPVVIPSGGE